MRTLLLLTPFSLLALTACSGSDEKNAADEAETDTDGNTDTDTGTDTDVPSEEASLRVLHLSPDAPSVDAYAAGAVAVTGLGFQSGTPYLPVPAGDLDVAIVPADGSIDDAVLELSLPLVGGSSYTAVAWRRVASLDALLLTDDASGIDPGNVRIQLVHAAADVGDVDVWALGSGTLLADDFAQGASAVLDVPVGPLAVGLDLDEDAVPDVTFDVPELPGGALYNVFAVNDDGGAFLLAQLPDGSVARVDPVPPTPKAELRVLHLSPDTLAVDVFVNQGAAPSFSGVPYGAGSGYAQVPAGTYSVQVSPSGSPAADAVLDVGGIELMDGMRYSAVAYGSLASIQALALVDDYADIAAGHLRLQLVHAAEGVGTVDVWELSGPTLLADEFAYGASGSLDVPSGPLAVGLDLDDDASPDVTFSVPVLGIDTLVNVYAVADANGPYLLAQFEDGTVATVLPD